MTNFFGEEEEYSSRLFLEKPKQERKIPAHATRYIIKLSSLFFLSANEKEKKWEKRAPTHHLVVESPNHASQVIKKTRKIIFLIRVTVTRTIMAN